MLVRGCCSNLLLAVGLKIQEMAFYLKIYSWPTPIPHSSTGDRYEPLSFKKMFRLCGGVTRAEAKCAAIFSRFLHEHKALSFLTGSTRLRVDKYCDSIKALKQKRCCRDRFSFSKSCNYDCWP